MVQTLRISKLLYLPPLAPPPFLCPCGGPPCAEYGGGGSDGPTIKGYCVSWFYKTQTDSVISCVSLVKIQLLVLSEIIASVLFSSFLSSLPMSEFKTGQIQNNFRITVLIRKSIYHTTVLGRITDGVMIRRIKDGVMIGRITDGVKQV